MLSNHVKEQAAKFDQTISYKLYSVGRKFTTKSRKYLKALEYSCHGIPWLLAMVVLCYVSRSKVWIRLLIGLIFDIIYVAISKAFFRRRRPAYSNQEDQMIMIGYDKLSFPSGHTSRAIYVALFFSGSWYSLLVWTWAIAVSASRVIYGRHFVGDILGGLVVGYWNYITQFSLFFPIHAMLEFFVLNLIGDGGDDF